MKIIRNNHPTKCQLRKEFFYFKGNLYRRREGQIASRLDINTGYRRVRFEGKVWSEHRLIYIMMKGPIPKGLVIDHIVD